MATTPAKSRAELQRRANQLAEELAQTALPELRQKFDGDKKRQSIDITMPGRITRDQFEFCGNNHDQVNEFGRLLLNSAARTFRLVLGCQEVLIVRSRQSNLDRDVIPGESALYTVRLVR